MVEKVHDLQILNQFLLDKIPVCQVTSSNVAPVTIRGWSYHSSEKLIVNDK